MPEKSIPEIIQSILDKNKGFMILSKLRDSLTTDTKQKLGIKSKESVGILRKKIETAAGENFMFHSKGSKIYILTPCEPAELVLGLMSSKKPLDTATFKDLPFTKEEIISVINSLLEDGRAKIKLDEKLKPQIFRAAVQEKPRQETITEEYTVEQFRRAFRELDRGRIAVRICDLRRKLNWPRDVFDQMLVDLRNQEIIQLRTGDASTMTEDEVKDCFVDENGFRRGSVTWDAR